MDLNKQCTSKRDVTHIKVKEFEYTWIIENFKFYHCKTGEKLQSPVFRMGDNSEYEWRLNLYPNGRDEEIKDYLTVYLELLKKATKRTAFLALSLVNGNGDESSDVSNELFIETKYQDYEQRVFRKFAERAYVLDKSNGLLPNGALTLRCKLYFTDEIVHCSHPSETFLPADQMLSKDFEKLLSDEKFSDVKLIIGDKELNVHKNVLAARSRVFAAMFDHPMKEQQENKVEIEDIDYDVMQQILHFIYTGKVNVEKAIPLYSDLLIAADKYELDGLKLLCEDSLIVKLSLRNVGTLLNLADRHKADELKKAAMKFIANHSKVLADSKKFKADMTALSPLLAEMLHIFMLKQ